MAERAGERHRAWIAALDRLDAELASAAGLLAGDAAPSDTDGSDVVGSPPQWSPPADLGPLPADLVARAMDVRERQTRVVSELGGRLGATARHRQLLEGLGALAGLAHRPPVYVDTTA